MNVTIDEAAARKRITPSLGSLARLPMDFFDPAIGLPALPPRSGELPGWPALFQFVPDPYMDLSLIHI